MGKLWSLFLCFESLFSIASLAAGVILHREFRIPMAYWSPSDKSIYLWILLKDLGP